MEKLTIDRGQHAIQEIRELFHNSIRVSEDIGVFVINIVSIWVRFPIRVSGIMNLINSGLGRWKVEKRNKLLLA